MKPVSKASFDKLLRASVEERAAVSDKGSRRSDEEKDRRASLPMTIALAPLKTTRGDEHRRVSANGAGDRGDRLDNKNDTSRSNGSNSNNNSSSSSSGSSHQSKRSKHDEKLCE